MITVYTFCWNEIYSALSEDYLIDRWSRVGSRICDHDLKKGWTLGYRWEIGGVGLGQEFVITI